MMRRQHHRPTPTNPHHSPPSTSARHSPRLRPPPPSIPINMSSIAAMASRRAFARQSLFRAPARRAYSSKVEEAGLDKAPRRDPELYVRIPSKPIELPPPDPPANRHIGSARCHVRCFPDRWMVNTTLFPTLIPIPPELIDLPDRPREGKKKIPLRPPIATAQQQHRYRSNHATKNTDPVSPFVQVLRQEAHLRHFREQRAHPGQLHALGA